MNINEVQPGAGIELRAQITEFKLLRKLWRCYECKKANKEVFGGLWKTEEEFQDKCPNCDAEQSTEKAKGLWIQSIISAVIKDDSGTIYLDLWNKDTDKYKVGDKIHLINGYARMTDFGVSVSKGKFGSILKEVEVKCK